MYKKRKVNEHLGLNVDFMTQKNWNMN